MSHFYINRRKYGNKRVLYDGHVFDSIMERDYYIELKGDKRVVDIELQPVFQLIPKFEKNGVKYRALLYKADFRVKYCDGTVKIIDRKGFKTKDFIIKHKLFEYIFPELSLTII